MRICHSRCISASIFYRVSSSLFKHLNEVAGQLLGHMVQKNQMNWWVPYFCSLENFRKIFLLTTFLLKQISVWIWNWNEYILLLPFHMLLNICVCEVNWVDKVNMDFTVLFEIGDSVGFSLDSRIVMSIHRKSGKWKRRG